MKPVYTLTLLLALLCSCKSRYTPDKNNLADLEGKIYFFAPEIDSATCEVSGHCDCCSAHLLFLDKHTFIYIDYCEGDEQYYKGTYLPDSGRIKLYFPDRCIAKKIAAEHDADSTDDNGVKFTCSTVMVRRDTVILSPLHFSHGTCYKTDNKEAGYGAPENKIPIADFIKTMREETVWYKLGLGN